MIVEKRKNVRKHVRSVTTRNRDPRTFLCACCNLQVERCALDKQIKHRNLEMSKTVAAYVATAPGAPLVKQNIDLAPLVSPRGSG